MSIFNACTSADSNASSTRFGHFKKVYKKDKSPENTAQMGWYALRFPYNTGQMGWYAI